jgi:hypothetical protein
VDRREFILPVLFICEFEKAKKRRSSPLNTLYLLAPMKNVLVRIQNSASTQKISQQKQLTQPW